MSVGIEFFAAAIKAATKAHGNRTATQEQWNALIASAGEFERVYKECAPAPDGEQGQDDEEDEDDE